MLWTIFVILLVLWLVGVISGSAFGGWVHLLLVVAAFVPGRSWLGWVAMVAVSLIVAVIGWGMA